MTKAGAGVVLTYPEGCSFQTAIMFDFPAMNNEAKYEALINGLEKAMAMDVKRLQIHINSQLVTYQVSGEYEAQDDRMMAYQEVVRLLLKIFEQIHAKLVPQNSNSQADALAQLVTSEGPTDMKEVTLTKLNHQSTSYSLIATLNPMDVDEDNWITPIIRHLKSGKLPPNRVQARQLQMRAARYTLIGDELYKRGFSLPYSSV